jgi:glycosyltransferase involved in cell wall biosynthesis
MKSSHQTLYLAIDGNEANVDKRVGSNQYAYSVLQALYQLDTPTTFTVLLKKPPLPDMPPPKSNWHYKVIKPGKLWTQWRLPLELYLHPFTYQAIYSPGHYAPRFSPIPSVISIMDLAFLKFPNLFLKYEKGSEQLKQWTQYSVKQAAHIIAISHNTKKDIIDQYQFDPQKITVAYPGIDRQFFKPASQSRLSETSKKYHLASPYLLYVGTIQPRKNLIRLLKAFESLPRTHKHLQLVIVGQKGWLYQDFLKLVNTSPRKDRVKFLGFVDPLDLPALYSGAVGSALVGLYEGFGLPAAESLACGTIPIISNSSSLPEAAGVAGVSVNPFSITSIKEGILFLLKMNSATKTKRLKQAQSDFEKFNWSVSAQIILKVLHAVALQR